MEWFSIADHTIKPVRKERRDVSPWTDPGYIIDHTPPLRLWARFQDVAMWWEEGEECG